MYGLEMLDVVARLRVGGVVPDEVVAGVVVNGGVRAVVDGEVEGDGGVASVHGLEVLDVVAGLGVNGVVPGEGVAGGAGKGEGHGGEDGEVQRDSGVAARHRRRNRVRYHSVRIHKELEAEAVIIHTGADAVEDLGMQHRVDKYVHCQHTVRPRHGCQPHRAVARRIEGYTVPRYRQIVLTNDAVHAFNDVVIDIEYECNRTVTSLDIWNHDCIGPRLRV